MSWNCTRLLSEALDKQVRSKSWGQKRLSSDLSGDERQGFNPLITASPKKSGHEKKYSRKGSKVILICSGLLVPPFPLLNAGAKKRNWLITFVLLEKRDPFVAGGV